MGVDFSMACVKPIDRVRFERLRGSDCGFEIRHHWLYKLFLPDELIPSLVSADLSYTWFTDCFDGYYNDPPQEPTFLAHCFDPEPMLACLTETWRTICAYNADLPCEYWLAVNEQGTWCQSMRVSWRGQRYKVTTGWDSCEAVSEGQEHAKSRIDLSAVSKLECDYIERYGHVVTREPTTGKMPLHIKKTTFAEQYGGEIEAMIGVCQTAIRNQAFVFTFLS